MKINICSSGNPTNPAIWSGTPYHLCSELQQKNMLGKAFDSNGTGFTPKILKLAAKCYYLGAKGDVTRSSFFRYNNARKVITETANSKSNYTLHTGTLDLPFKRFPQTQKHYLYCDSTWNLYCLFSNTENYSKRLLRDAENMERKAYQQMEHIFTTSKYVKDNLISHYGINSNKITVAGTGLGVIKPYYGEKNYSNKKILFAAKGNFENKGGPFVLQALEMALEKMPDLQLTIVGQNQYIQQIKHPNITVLGFIPIEELQAIFNDCSLFLMPAFYEPWGLVYLEALACRMPIVGLNRNSFPELSGYGKYGFALNNPDPVAMANILTEAFSQPELLERMGKSGQEYCLNTFSWSNTIDKVITVIKANFE
jgi:glycosyltransferase involved in cell wall biosynthesis